MTHSEEEKYDLVVGCCMLSFAKKDVTMTMMMNSSQRIDDVKYLKKKTIQLRSGTKLERISYFRVELHDESLGIT